MHALVKVVIVNSVISCMQRHGAGYVVAPNRKWRIELLRPRLEPHYGRLDFEPARSRAPHHLARSLEVPALPVRGVEVGVKVVLEPPAAVERQPRSFADERRIWIVVVVLVDGAEFSADQVRQHVAPHAFVQTHRYQISGRFREGGGEPAPPPPFGRRTDAVTHGHVS